MKKITLINIIIIKVLKTATRIEYKKKHNFVIISNNKRWKCKIYLQSCKEGSLLKNSLVDRSIV